MAIGKAQVARGAMTRGLMISSTGEEVDATEIVSGGTLSSGTWYRLFWKGDITNYTVIEGASLFFRCSTAVVVSQGQGSTAPAAGSPSTDGEFTYIANASLGSEHRLPILDVINASDRAMWIKCASNSVITYRPEFV